MHRSRTVLSDKEFLGGGGVDNDNDDDADDGDESTSLVPSIADISAPTAS